MTDIKKPVVVFGATGQQGAAVVQQLHSHNWLVRAVSRDPSKGASLALKQTGVEVLQANLQDRSSLEQVLDGAYGVFSVQQPQEHGPQAEIVQGKLLAEVAKAAGVQHLVYSSGGGAERNTGLPHIDSKWEIERYIHSLDIPTTILRPVFFMSNFSWPDFRNAIEAGTLMVALHPQTRLQMIAPQDIGAFARLAFDKPQEFLGRAIEIAGDELTMPQAAQVFSRVLGRLVEFVEQPLEQLRSFNVEMAQTFQWFNDYGNQANLVELRQLYPELLTLEAWLKAMGWGQTK